MDRPKSFESKEARTRWDWIVARNAMKLKAQLESGEVLPEQVKDSLDFNVVVPEDEKRLLTKDGAVHRKTYKLRYEEICYILQWCFVNFGFVNFGIPPHVLLKTLMSRLLYIIMGRSCDDTRRRQLRVRNINIQ